MPIRGRRSIWPDAGGKPTGILKQPQKKDPVTASHTGLMAYAHGKSTRSKPVSNGGQSLRHLKPKSKVST